MLYRRYEEPVGKHWYRVIGFDQCRLRGFWSHVVVRTVRTVQPRKKPQGQLGVIREVARHGRQGRLKPHDMNYFLNCGGGT